MRRRCAAPFAVVAIDCHAASVCRIVDVVASNSFMLITNTHDTYLRADAVAKFGARSAAAAAAEHASERGGRQRRRGRRRPELAGVVIPTDVLAPARVHRVLRTKRTAD